MGDLHQLVEAGHHPGADVEDGVGTELGGGGGVDGPAHVGAVHVLEVHGVLLGDPGRRAPQSGGEQALDLGPARSAGEVAVAVGVGRSQRDQLEAVVDPVALGDQLLDHLGVAVGPARAPGVVLGHGAARGAPPVVDGEAADVDQPPHPGQPDRLGHIDGPAHVHLQAGVERVRDPVGDQPGGVDHGVDRVVGRGRHQRGQVPDVGADGLGGVVGAQPPSQIVGPGVEVEEDQLLAPAEGVLGEGGPDQPDAGDQSGHRAPLLDSTPIRPAIMQDAAPGLASG